MFNLPPGASKSDDEDDAGGSSGTGGGGSAGGTFGKGSGSGAGAGSASGSAGSSGGRGGYYPCYVRSAPTDNESCATGSDSSISDSQSAHLCSSSLEINNARYATPPPFTLGAGNGDNDMKFKMITEFVQNQDNKVLNLATTALKAMENITMSFPKPQPPAPISYPVVPHHSSNSDSELLKSVMLAQNQTLLNNFMSYSRGGSLQQQHMFNYRGNIQQPVSPPATCDVTMLGTPMLSSRHAVSQRRLLPKVEQKDIGFNDSTG